jgi:NAD(P)-dependent dehydrogenase (short-subunit alcohol dehydrogenase family)
LGLPGGPAALATQVRALVGDHLDILVSNAGISYAGRTEDHTVEPFVQLFATNVRSAFFIVQQLLPILGEGSSVILVSSLAARAVPGNPGQAALLHFPLTPRRRAQSTPWSSIGHHRSEDAEFASTPWHRASSPRICRTSRKRRAGESSPSACRR